MPEQRHLDETLDENQDLRHVEHDERHPRGHFVDPAEEAWSHNPNLSPPIHPRLEREGGPRR